MDVVKPSKVDRRCPIDPETKSSETLSHGANRDLFFEQYKLYVESALQISQRRESANTYFLTVNTLLFAGLSGASATGLQLGWWSFSIAVCGVVLCCWWSRLIRSYKDLNTGKFAIIHRFEKELPAKPFTDEWDLLGKGEDPKKYKPVTELEMKIPWIFATLYLVVPIGSFAVVPWC